MRNYLENSVGNNRVWLKIYFGGEGESGVEGGGGGEIYVTKFSQKVLSFKTHKEPFDVLK